MAFVVMELFLNLKGGTLDADDAVCNSMMLTLPADKLSEEMLAKWLRGHIERDSHPGRAQIPVSDWRSARYTNTWTIGICNQQFLHSACLVIFSSTPTHASVTNSDDPP